MPQIQSAKDVMETLSDTVSTLMPQSTSNWLISSKRLLSNSMSVLGSLLFPQAPVAGQGRQSMVLTETPALPTLSQELLTSLHGQLRVYQQCKGQH